MISKHYFDQNFSLAAAQELQSWADSNIVVAPPQTDNLIIDSGFSDPSKHSLQTAYASISGGKFNIDLTGQTASTSVSSNIISPLEVGSSYTLTVDVDSTTDGYYRFILGGTVSDFHSSTGTKTNTIVCDSSSALPKIQGVQGCIATFDNFTCVKDGTTPVEPPPPVGGIETNTIEAMWADMREQNTGWVSNMKSSIGQFDGPYDYPDQGIKDTNFDSVNMWLEIEEAGDGSGCSERISQSSNTMVEIGSIYQYLYQNGVWRLGAELKNTQTPSDKGGNHPHASNAMSRDCHLDESQVEPLFEHWDLVESEYAVRTNSNGFIEYMPDYYYRYHCWNPGGLGSDPGSEVDGVLGCCFVRLVLKDPNGVDDRHLAEFVGHLGSDIRNDGSYIGDIGINRYKKITNDWVAMNFHSWRLDIKPNSVAELAALNPPIILEPSSY